MLVPGLDTYADLATLTEILADYGHGSYLDSASTLDQEAHARSARLYLDHAFAWVGTRSVPGQPLAWPRSGAIDQDGLVIAPDVVPAEIVTAQSLLMCAAGSGDLAGGTGGTGGSGNPDREIRREAPDDASIEFAPGSADRKFPMVSALVRHLTTAHRLGPFRQVQAVRG
jgi:hypothetical protein